MNGKTRLNHVLTQHLDTGDLGLNSELSLIHLVYKTYVMSSEKLNKNPDKMHILDICKNIL